MKQNILLFLILLLPSVNSLADYRAFQLLIINPQTGTERTILSTLDDIQFPEYYALRPGEIIQISDTWMCYNNASYFKPICNNPRQAE
ncbi:MAG: hypothetical protein R2827_12465 [Bdellovibrionales bacterium]